MYPSHCELHHRARLIMVISPDQRHGGSWVWASPTTLMRILLQPQPIGAGEQPAGPAMASRAFGLLLSGNLRSGSLSMTHKEMRRPASLLSRIALHVLAYDLRRFSGYRRRRGDMDADQRMNALTRTLRVQGSLSTAIAPDRHLYARRNRTHLARTAQNEARPSGSPPGRYHMLWTDRGHARRMFYVLAGGASATAASAVSIRNVNVSCR